MANASPARDQFHVTERYRTRPSALRRIMQVSSAGYRAYMVDMAGVTPAAGRYVVHVSEGRRGDLRALPTPTRRRAPHSKSA
jgi:hypothetical protein